MSSLPIGCSALETYTPGAATGPSRWRRLARLIASEHRIRRATRETAALDDRMLRDIGLDRGDLGHAAWFGRGWPTVRTIRPREPKPWCLRSQPHHQRREKVMSPKPWRWSTCIGLPSVLAVVLAACVVATPRLAPPAPATLTAVRGLAPHVCNATTASALDALGVPPAAVRSIYYERPDIGSSHGITARGYRAWVRLADQSGDLVIRHDDGCRFVASYASGTLQLGPGRSSETLFGMR